MTPVSDASIFYGIKFYPPTPQMNQTFWKTLGEFLRRWNERNPHVGYWEDPQNPEFAFLYVMYSHEVVDSGRPITIAPHLMGVDRLSEMSLYDCFIQLSVTVPVSGDKVPAWFLVTRAGIT